MNKPWLKVNLDDHMWFASSRHKLFRCGYTSENIKQPIPIINAFVIVQNCNMGGAYFRIIFWDDNNDRYFQSVHMNEADVWPFDIDRENLMNKVEKDIVTDNRTGLKYKVIKDTPFIKTFERI